MTSNFMIKITNNSTATSTAFNGNTIAASRILYTPFAGNINIEMNADGDKISNISDGTNVFSIGTGANGLERIQLGNLSRAGVFYANLDSA